MGALISDEYRAAMREMHDTVKAFGTHDVHFAPMAREVTRWGEKSLLVYGAGKGALGRRLGPQYAAQSYDPGVPGLDAPPEPAEVVFCTDVLEHVEPECVDAVVADLRRLTRETAVIAVHTCAAIKFLPDGRNTHLTQQPPDWWRAKLQEHGFTITVETPSAKEVLMVCQ